MKAEASSSAQDRTFPGHGAVLGLHTRTQTGVRGDELREYAAGHLVTDSRRISKVEAFSATCAVFSAVCFCCLATYILVTSLTSPSGIQHGSVLGPGGGTAISGDKQPSVALESPTGREHVAPPADQQSFVSLWDLAHMPLLGIHRMGLLTLRWGEEVAGDATEMAFEVTGLTRRTSKLGLNNAPGDYTSVTTVQLSGGYRCVITHESATLHDSSGSVVHSMVRVHELQGPTTKPEPVKTQFLDGRRLEPKPEGGMFKKPKETGFAPVFLPNGPPPQPQGPPTSFMDAYCRYGCGGMSVTFPYYYRPFFGYGYPLVGTEAMFPQGYGGYAAAPLLASQGGAPVITGAAGPVLAGGVSAAALGMPGAGAANVVGGVQPVAVALPGM
ncbi:transmembrane protein [Cystoisospora suis]|uniref:Transmembrane protein n=1 Tax=Cystoisospora suis TaxID=483139 RepID=A0A2C6L223_9APIC|nr:transmembrane protein [Cystoisospora suis]